MNSEALLLRMTARARQAPLGAQLAQTLHKTLPAFPGVGQGFAVGFSGVRGFSSAHESVAGTVVGDGLKSFACGLQVSDRFGDGGADALVIAGVETVDRGFDSRHGILVWRRTVKYERSGKIRPI